MEAETVNKEYQGANVRRWREWRNMNQDVLADLIGVSQATMSGIERKTNIDTETVEKNSKSSGYTGRSNYRTKQRKSCQYLYRQLA